MNPPRLQCWRFLIILVIAFASRLALSSYLIKERRSDQVEPNRVAASLARDGVFGGVYYPGSGPTAHLAPLHPLLLGSIYRVWGIESPKSLLIQSYLAILMFSLVVAWLPQLAEQAGFGSTPGLVASAVMILLPFNLYAETSGTWEQAEASLALVALVSLFIALHDRNWNDLRLVFALGLLAGLIGLLSPVLLGAGALMGFAELVTQKGHRARVLRGGVIAGVVALAMLTPWAWRNARVLGAPVFTRSNFGLELYVGNHDDANGVLNNRGNGKPNFVYSHHPYTNAAERAHYIELGELNYMKEKRDLGLRWILAHPARFVVLSVRRFSLFLFTGPELWPTQGKSTTMKFLLFCGLGIAAVFGLGYLVWTGHPLRWIFLAGVIGPALPYSLTSVDFRYRYPIYPLTVLLSVLVAGVLLRKLTGKHSANLSEGSTQVGG